MATYVDLYDLQNETEFLHKMAVAVVVAADTIRSEDAGTTNHANRMEWAAKAFTSPQGTGKQALWAVLAANKGADTATILAASDSTIQTAVDAAVDVLAGI